MSVIAPAVPQLVTSFAELRDRARPDNPLRLGVVVADDEIALSAADAAMRLGIAQPVLIGDEHAIRIKMRSLAHEDLDHRAEIVDAQEPAKTAVRMAGKGELHLLLKGHLRTDELLHAVLD